MRDYTTASNPYSLYCLDNTVIARHACMEPGSTSILPCPCCIDNPHVSKQSHNAPRKDKPTVPNAGQPLSIDGSRFPLRLRTIAPLASVGHSRRLWPPNRDPSDNHAGSSRRCYAKNTLEHGSRTSTPARARVSMSAVAFCKLPMPLQRGHLLCAHCPHSFFRLRSAEAMNGPWSRRRSLWCSVLAVTVGTHRAMMSKTDARNVRPMMLV